MQYFIPMDTYEYDIIRHPRCIIHLDVDCFYAQVEMLRHPEYDGKPFGVQQKNMVVTSNYIARGYGIRKCMPVQDALRLCPELVLVNGEDLTAYRQFSAKIMEILHDFTPLVESDSIEEDSRDIIGNVFELTDEECPCGCHLRLAIATKIASKIRDRVWKELKITCSAGIAHNKLLAKLAGSLYKPNQQTLIFPCSASKLLSTLDSVSKIPGVGLKTKELLISKNLRTVEDLRKIPLHDLELKIGKDLARKLKDNAEGIDETAVKPSAKKQSIGIEDGFKSVSLVGEVEQRLSALLRRLTELATEDGRIPIAMRITVRKHDFNKPKRETRQCALPKHLLPSSKSGVYDHAKMLILAMKLFHRAVDISKPFHLTLLGVAFTKFEERSYGRSSITSFLRKQVAVQSILDISSEEGICDISLGSPMSINQDSNDSSEHSLSATSLSNSLPGINGSPISKLTISSSQCTEDDLLSEVEPQLKKTKLEVWLNGRRETPSNEMAGLRLESSPMQISSKMDTTILKTLPVDLQREVSRPWPTTSKPKPNNILKYFIANK
ncbi:DNA polymerase iota-like isoform X2 [Polistes fuscatus]|uniref:DNA polymerase iota-like isoform X2 n=1 Tax=Polistes fuscatus TaxID=30207 RepID=UPI001CA9ECEB|nr:DNA polymerase iota-like isoform X2 [Polistes fuscatus]